jgi:hypothetical protein
MIICLPTACSLEGCVCIATRLHGVTPWMIFILTVLCLKECDFIRIFILIIMMILCCIICK